MPDHPEHTFVDPVCGMTVTPAGAAGHVEYEGHTYYFCGLSCVKRFQADPAKYLNPAPSAPQVAVAGAEYTCPMHPEIVQDHPGSCPICGMALEPRTVTMDDGPNPELVDMSRRLLVSTALSAPLLIGAMGRSVDAIAGEDATVYLLVWPKRIRPLIRGANREEIEGAFPGWKITHTEPSGFVLPKPLEILLRPNEHWYRLRRR
jgi:YHS domain-containing protein